MLAAVVLTLSWAMVGSLFTPAEAAPGDIGTMDQSFSGVTNPPTSDKPQSKLWFNDGLWWATMFESASKTWHIFRLDRQSETWVDTGTRVDDRLDPPVVAVLRLDRLAVPVQDVCGAERRLVSDLEHGRGASALIIPTPP